MSVHSTSPQFTSTYSESKVAIVVVGSVQIFGVDKGAHLRAHSKRSERARLLPGKTDSSRRAF